MKSKPDDGAIRPLEFRLRRRNHQIAPAMSASPTTPAMTPPAIAPTFVFFPLPELALESSFASPDVGEGLVVLALVGVVEVALDPADDSGGLEAARVCAAVMLKLSNWTTSRYAQAGTEVPGEISLGYLFTKCEVSNRRVYVRKKTYTLGKVPFWQFAVQVDQLTQVVSCINE